MPAALAGCGSDSPEVRSVFSAADIRTKGYNDALGRGLNLGNALDAPNEGDWGVTLEASYFDTISRAGFDSVRLPVRWSAHADELPPHRIDPDFLERVAWAVREALQSGLMVVLNMHHYGQVMRDPEAELARFLDLWRQIADRFETFGPELVFEILNEPAEQLDARAWNDLLAAAIRTIRESNPERLLIVGPANYNTIGSLRELELPENDRNLIVGIHYYEPLEFTQQGGDWLPGSEAWIGTRWQGSAEQRARIEADFDSAAAWADRRRRPLYLGEFGAVREADHPSRVRWVSYVARQAELRGMSWAYWEFASNFGVYDRQSRQWDTDLLDALLANQ